MATYIFIDNATKTISGDSRRIEGYSVDGAPAEVARLLDAARGIEARSYSERDTDPQSEVDGYHVYRVDIGSDGSDAVPLVTDGSDPAVIHSVERLCEYSGFVERHREGVAPKSREESFQA